jgi:predicted HicB family RNase H-like nuclease
MLSFLIEMEGYRARIERDRDGTLHGRVIEIEEVIYFRANTLRMVERKFSMALENYFERCKQMGVQPEKPIPMGF